MPFAEAPCTPIRRTTLPSTRPPAAEMTMIPAYTASSIVVPVISGFVDGPTQMPALPNVRIVESRTTRLETEPVVSTPTSFQL